MNKIIITLCILGIILLSWYSVANQIAHESSQNYHEYLDKFYFGEEKGGGLPMDVAIALKDTNIYSLPMGRGTALENVSAGTFINVIENQRDLYFLLLEERGELPKTIRRERLRWAPVRSGNQRGWVDATTFRPATMAEKRNAMLKTLHKGFEVAFPQDTTKEKVIAWLVSIPISIFFGIIAWILFGRIRLPFWDGDFGVDDLVAMGTPFVIWYLKTEWVIGISFTELVTVSYGMAIIFFACSLPSEFVLRCVKIWRKSS